MLSKMNLPLVLSLLALVAAVVGAFHVNDIVGWFVVALALLVAEWRISQ